MLISHFQSLHGIRNNSEGLIGTIDPQCDLLFVSILCIVAKLCCNITCFFVRLVNFNEIEKVITHRSNQTKIALFN